MNTLLGHASGYLKSLLAIILLCSLAGAAQVSADTFAPESGWWWNPNESGRGYSIEIQDNTVFLAAYTYESEQTAGVNKATWFVASGTLTGTNEFSGQLLEVENGQCFGCDYQAPTNDVAHDISIVFTSRTEANISVDGENIAIERFYFAPSFLSHEEKLMGQWALVSDEPRNVEGSSDGPLGEVLVLDELIEDEDGYVVAGCRALEVGQTFCTQTDKADRLVLAGYSTEIQQYFMLVSQTSQFDRGYWMTLDSDIGQGWVDQFESGGEFNTSFEWGEAVRFQAFRSASKSIVAWPTKPSVASKVTDVALAASTQEHKPVDRGLLSELDKQQIKSDLVQRLSRVRQRLVQNAQ
ncbi:hypothetical protein QWI17_13510 [Gilvimarinus sp. SDUM040013]|uniref:Uncharacterized protein n=1 Tax=Gilvimarinus gilvus TaxID=3058038 RepID=A0ABU4RVB2_9GAMM|nr:hypothetical protein [Gilvimarinus sp. SDUM040013]MDO3386859.1 hypothetical protein [Gilvimarinus sp. SDUM040013]MDX6848211.1 hypothetical protein [Gilvimarinus sp. SDUM040013]